VLDRRRVATVLLLLTGSLLLAGFLLKAQCKADYNADRDRLLCSNDIQFLYWVRGLAEHRFPYVDGALVDGQLTGGVLEYPVLTGLAAWAPSLVADDASQYLDLVALTLVPFALLTTVLLGRMVRWRALLWALSPPLVWYSFHNWDHLVVAATVAAVYLWWRGHPTWAAVLLAVGCSLKLWPGFLVAPLVLWSWHRGARQEAARGALAAVGTWAAVNVPFLAVNRDGWWAPYAFQELRAADITSNSIWFWAEVPLDTEQLNRLIPVLLVVTWLVAWAAGWMRARSLGTAYPWVQVGAAMLCAFLLLNKAHSPQFALWLLPFFALVRLRWGWWTAYLAFDSLLYVGLFRWYHDLSQGRDFGIWKQMLVLGVWGRAAMLVLLFVVLLRSDLALRPADEEADEPERPEASPRPEPVPV
jgi:uncharacterized membrane protein